MGSSASKAARKYPEAISKTVKHGMRRPFVPPVAASGNGSAHLAETHKSEGARASCFCAKYKNVLASFLKPLKETLRIHIFLPI